MLNFLHLFNNESFKIFISISNLISFDTKVISMSCRSFQTEPKNQTRTEPVPNQFGLNRFINNSVLKVANSSNSGGYSSAVRLTGLNRTDFSLKNINPTKSIVLSS